MTSTMHSATASSFPHRYRCDRSLLLLALLEISEELARRIEHQQIGLVFEYVHVGVDAAIEAEELGILIERRRIDRRGFRVAVAARFFRLPIRFGRDDYDLSVGVGANFERALAALLRGTAAPESAVRSSSDRTPRC